jgi:transposase
MTPDYKRKGTTTLFAALDVAEGRLIGTCMPRHRHQEFIKVLKQIDAETPPELDLHLIVDNDATHKHRNVQKWLKRHSRFHRHLIPTSSSWLNLVERWFREITAKRLRRGVFPSVERLIAAIESSSAENNNDPRPLVWTATAKEILENVGRARAALDKVASD